MSIFPHQAIGPTLKFVVDDAEPVKRPLIHMLMLVRINCHGITWTWKYIVRCTSLLSLS
jgi:hypothetical protein